MQIILYKSISIRNNNQFVMMRNYGRLWKDIKKRIKSKGGIFYQELLYLPLTNITSPIVLMRKTLLMSKIYNNNVNLVSEIGRLAPKGFERLRSVESFLRARYSINRKKRQRSSFNYKALFFRRPWSKYVQLYFLFVFVSAFFAYQQLIIRDISWVDNLFQISMELYHGRYRLHCTYNDGLKKVYTFKGNLNDLARFFDFYFQNSEKPRLRIKYQTYTFKEAILDSALLLFSFIGLAITFFIFRRSNPDRILNRILNKNFSSFKVKSLKDIKTKFQDVAGMEEAKRQITQFVDFLKNSEEYVQMGAKIPKGALLTGPPGTGKTMLAKACAGQANVSFFYVSGSQFVEMFVGLGASKARELFRQARLDAPSIIFIDEIDAIGKKRESSHNQESDATLNQILVEMDGFSSTETVVVMAATNRPDVLDNALKRPGRFDRIVEVNLPQLQARVKIFKVHLRPIKLNSSITVDDVAKRMAQLTPGYSGADIANICNEAAIIATRSNKESVTMKDFEDASERVTAGYEKKGLANQETKKRVAYHEAGHAVCGWFLKGGDPLVKLTIIPRSKGALGYAQYLPGTKFLQTRDQLIDRVAILLGGISSQKIFYGQFSSGGSDDLQKVYSLARAMIGTYGMGKDTYNVTVENEDYVKKESEYLHSKVDQEMNSIIDEAIEKAKTLLESKRSLVEKMAEMLVEKETINTVEIKSILGERPTFTQ